MCRDQKCSLENPFALTEVIISGVACLIIGVAVGFLITQWRLNVKARAAA